MMSIEEMKSRIRRINQILRRMNIWRHIILVIATVALIASMYGYRLIGPVIFGCWISLEIMIRKKKRLNIELDMLDKALKNEVFSAKLKADQ